MTGPVSRNRSFPSRNAAKLSRFVSHKVRVRTSPVRWYEGTFLMTDKYMNVILEGACVVRASKHSRAFQKSGHSQWVFKKQSVGLVVIRGASIVSIAVVKEREAKKQDNLQFVNESLASAQRLTS